MADEAVKIETPEEIREAIAVLAREVLTLREMAAATARLAQGMDVRLRALTGLVDHDHAVLTKIAGLPPRPKKGGFSVN